MDGMNWLQRLMEMPEVAACRKATEDLSRTTDALASETAALARETEELRLSTERLSRLT